jgi:hypothetical protein
MPRTSKSPSSGGNSKNREKKSASGSPEQKAAGKFSIDGGETPLTPLDEPAETSASLQPFMDKEDQPGEVAKLIAKLTDSPKKNDSILPSQEVNPSTPPVSLSRELEEHQSKPAEVTFIEKAAAASVPSDLRNSRRHKVSRDIIYQAT